MVTMIEWGFLGLLTTLTGLLSAFIVWKVIQPGLERFVAAKERTIPAQMKKQLKDFMNEQLEGVDLEGVAGSLGANAGGVPGIEAIGGLLGGGEGSLGGLGELLKLFSQLSGKNKGGGGSSGGGW